MRQYAVATLWFGILLSASCATDRSGKQPFAQYVGQAVALQRGIDLWRLPHPVFVARYYLSDSEQFGYSQHVATLPKGSELLIKKVVFFEGVDAQYILALGEVTDPVTGRKVQFEYDWNYYAKVGERPQEHGIRRAPWEAEDVPSYRYVGYSGDAYTPNQK